MSLTSNMNNYRIYSENEVSSIISHFSKDYIIDIIKDSMTNRLNPYAQLPNIVMSIETDYKNNLESYPDMSQILYAERDATYKEIIGILCEYYNLTFAYDKVTDYYSAAYFLYELLVSNFSNNITTFFTVYINKEKNNLYESLNLIDLKRNKDSNTAYNKKVYKNQKLAIINANLEYVLDTLCNVAIPYDVILNTLYTDKNIARYIRLITNPNVDFYQLYFVKNITNPMLKPIFITSIRLEIQKLTIDESINPVSQSGL